MLSARVGIVVTALVGTLALEIVLARHTAHAALKGARRRTAARLLQLVGRRAAQTVFGP